MNIYYAKVALYAYPNLEKILEQIDEIVERKALSSMYDFTPCEHQSEKILRFTHQKDILIEMKLVLDKILKKFTDNELDLFDYKYFRIKDKEYYKDFDFSSRVYFRNQNKAVKKFAKYLEESGYDEKFFENRIFKIDFFVELLKRVLDHEKLTYKNKPKTSDKECEKIEDKIILKKQNKIVKSA